MAMYHYNIIVTDHTLMHCIVVGRWVWPTCEWELHCPCKYF